jgi:hypothetical protein
MASHEADDGIGRQWYKLSKQLQELHDVAMKFPE